MFDAKLCQACKSLKLFFFESLINFRWLNLSVIEYNIIQVENNRDMGFSLVTVIQNEMRYIFKARDNLTRLHNMPRSWSNLYILYLIQHINLMLQMNAYYVFIVKDQLIYFGGLFKLRLLTSETVETNSSRTISTIRYNEFI